MKKSVLSAWVLIVVGIVMFIALAANLDNPSLLTHDKNILKMFRNPENLDDPIGSKSTEEIMIDVASLGSTTTLTVLVAGILWFCLLIKRYGTIVYLLSTILAGTSLSIYLKGIFERPRPELFKHFALAGFSSFPSGHAMSAAIVYLTLALLIGRFYPQKRIKVYCVVFAVMCLTMVGVGRIYVGVHWPSDIYSAYAAGLAWTLFWWIVFYHTSLKTWIEKLDQFSSQQK